ncbi:hypothetical protein SDC9_86320 [bioreactor metagenome]|uniref:Uncharacterized protein n=1 Tax=bioreactor metagenome TaxID=1076179 RepID=A0A644ZFS1_9ZZZZ
MICRNLRALDRTAVEHLDGSAVGYLGKHIRAEHANRNARADAQTGGSPAARCNRVGGHSFVGGACYLQRAALGKRNGRFVADDRFGLCAGNMHGHRARETEVALRVPGFGVRGKHKLTALAAGCRGELKAARRNRAVFDISVVGMQRHRDRDADAEREGFLLLIG